MLNSQLYKVLGFYMALQYYGVGTYGQALHQLVSSQSPDSVAAIGECLSARHYMNPWAGGFVKKVFEGLERAASSAILSRAKQLERA